MLTYSNFGNIGGGCSCDGCAEGIRTRSSALWGRLCITSPKQRQRQTARAAQTMQRYGSATAATEHAPRQREQRRLWRSNGSNRASSATASMADYASLRRSNGSDRASIATARAAQTMQGYNGALVAATEHHRDSERSAEYVEQRQGAEYVEQRQQQSMHRDGSRADFALLRQSNGSVISCITTARAALVSHGQPSFSSHIMFNMFLCEHTLSFSNGSCH